MVDCFVIFVKLKGFREARASSQDLGYRGGGFSAKIFAYLNFFAVQNWNLRRKLRFDVSSYGTVRDRSEAAPFVMACLTHGNTISNNFEF